MRQWGEPLGPSNIGMARDQTGSFTISSTRIAWTRTSRLPMPPIPKDGERRCLASDGAATWLTVKCSAILLDVDGTLIDSTRVVERIWQVWSAEYGIDPETVLRDAHGRRSEDTICEIVTTDQVERALRRIETTEL
jgi:hypothetical protein